MVSTRALSRAVLEGVARAEAVRPVRGAELIKSPSSKTRDRLVLCAETQSSPWGVRGVVDREGLRLEMGVAFLSARRREGMGVARAGVLLADSAGLELEAPVLVGLLLLKKRVRKRAEAGAGSESAFIRVEEVTPKREGV